MKNTIISIIVAITLISFAVFFTGNKDSNQNNNSDNDSQNQVEENEFGNTKNNTETGAKPVKALNKNEGSTQSNVSNTDGKQIIEITAKGGYTPRKSIAKSGVPTILRFNTKGTFDCSSSVRIPSKGISQFLPQSGTTDIDLGINDKGTLNGSCGMGMYPFAIEFQ